MNALALPVIPLTITVSLCLVFTFVVFFLREHSRRFSNAERESLLPLAEEIPRLATSAHDHDHDHTDDNCGCRTGRKTPCRGCRKSSDSTSSS
jgi:ABC-type nickel/cobalt efflux system permease component RcnA